MARLKQVDITKLRYVLYARKSTEDETRQVRSIDDQIRDCQKLAADLGLRVIGEPVKETKSAKKPNHRPKFTQLLKNIESKKYDAILCWHPDRLCRNMLEGGQIINMLDEGTLKDMRFHSHQFSNDANGKMLLGMLFVFSKQYSDDLSDKVNRGVQGNFDDGISQGAPKYGYTRDEATGRYEPNEYYDLVKNAWNRRISGDSLRSITNYLVENGMHRITKNKIRQRKLIPTVSTLSNTFKDPIYYGTLLQSDQTTDLTQIYDFRPMVTKDEYEQVQSLGNGRTKDIYTKKRTTFYPLHGFVYCAVCTSPKYMVVGKNRTGSGKHVLTYRCDNKQCNRHPKSLRARNVFESIYTALDRIEMSEKAYERYSTEIENMTEDKIIEIKQTIHSKRGALNHLIKEINDRSLTLGILDKNSAAYEPNVRRLESLAGERDNLETKIGELESKISNPNQIKLNKEEFLNLVKTAADKMRAGSAVEKDILSRILFLNLHVNNEKVVDFIWNEPFATMIKLGEIQPGGGAWI